MKQSSSNNYYMMQTPESPGTGVPDVDCQSCLESSFTPWRKLKTNHLLFLWQQHLASFGHLFQFLQIICKFSIMAIHSFCHLEEPVPQNNDLKKAHLLVRKSLHLGSSTHAAKRCFVKFRSLTFSGMRISEQTDYWELPSYSSGTVSFIATCCGLTSYWTIESWRHQSYMFPTSNLVYLTFLHRTKEVPCLLNKIFCISVLPCFSAVQMNFVQYVLPKKELRKLKSE
ncbi:uncharacterized protein LOC128904604 [Rissa tridactyla]|uniref:uncharacterized protein LOC128904604 n=1 Tax=Rissa tridactyla TaxID=75485 RepID=UPI0023BA6BC1|nr:uncharacterized protein LOC128904604 [Rissa tridactyla]